MAAPETLPLDHMTTEGTQARAALSETIIHEYAAAMARGDVFPPIEVYFDEMTYWLADGFHRVKAATIAGHTTIAAVVHAGGTREALRHAVSANEEHGYRRTDADRRHAVSLLLADAAWRAWNNSAAPCQGSVAPGRMARDSTGGEATYAASPPLGIELHRHSVTRGCLRCTR